MRKSRVFVFGLAFWVAAYTCSAQTAPPYMENRGDWNSASPILMINNPDGSGTPFDDCYLDGSRTVTTSNITVYIAHGSNHDLPYGELARYRWSLVFYEIEGTLNYGCNTYTSVLTISGSTQSCLFESCVEPSGIYRIAFPLNAGGSGSALVKLVCNFYPPVELELGRVYFISTDINASGVTNLSDVPAFNSMLSSGTYHKEIDFAYDGVNNLSDIPYFASHMGAACP